MFPRKAFPVIHHSPFGQLTIKEFFLFELKINGSLFSCIVNSTVNIEVKMAHKMQTDTLKLSEASSQDVEVSKHSGLTMVSPLLEQ